MNRPLKRNAGFSLTEVLMAAGILALGFMMLLTLFPLGLQLTAKQTEATIGTLTIRDAMFNTSILLQSNVAKRKPVRNNGFDDLRTIYWDVASDDADGDGYIDDFESDYVADNGNYELPYDPYLFLYPTASDVSDSDKKYNSAVLVGNTNGNYAESIVFACRRAGIQSQFPVDVTDPLPVSNRPGLLWLDNFTVSNNVLIFPSLYDIRPYIASDSSIVIDNSGVICKVQEIIVPDTANGIDYYQVRLDINATGANKIWFVPPAVGAKRSAAVDVARQTIRIM